MFFKKMMQETTIIMSNCFAYSPDITLIEPHTKCHSCNNLPLNQVNLLIKKPKVALIIVLLNILKSKRRKIKHIHKKTP